MDEGIKDAKKRPLWAAQNEATCIELSRQNSDLRTALRAKDADYRALLEAVEWERECESQSLFMREQYDWLPQTMRGISEMRETYRTASSVVDALVGAK